MTNYTDLQSALAPMVRQLDKLDERTRADLAEVRREVAEMRKELVAKDSLTVQLSALTGYVTRIEADCAKDKLELKTELAEIKKEQISRNDRLWIRVGQALAIAAFALAMFQFLTHFKLVP